MVATVASIDVTLRLLGADRFQADMRSAGSISEQTGARVARSMDSIGASSERAATSISSIARSNTALTSIAYSALKAETSIGALGKAFTLFGTVVGGLAGGVAANAFKNYADQAILIQNRLASVIPNQQARLAIDQKIFDTAQNTRTSYEATANLFSRLTLSSGQLGASQEQVLRVVETTKKSLIAGGATVAESASIATQLTQALGSGRLQGDELRSLAENSPILIQSIAKEFGVTVGQLKQLGSDGELSAERVFKAILKSSDEVDSIFARTTPTIAAGIQQIDNALIRYIGTVDKSLGASKALIGGLGFISTNLNSIGDSAALAVAALAGPLAGRAINRAAAPVMAPFRAESAAAQRRLEEARAAASAATEARQSAQVGALNASKALGEFDAQPRFRQASPDVQASYTRQATQADRLAKAASDAAEKQANALLKVADAEGIAAQASQTASNRAQAARDRLVKREQDLQALIAKRPALEAAVDAGPSAPPRPAMANYYKALANVMDSRDKLAATNATILLTKSNITALDEAINRERSRPTPGDFLLQAQAKRQAEVDRLPQLTSQRDTIGKGLNDAEATLRAQEAKLSGIQISEAEKRAVALGRLDAQIAQGHARVAAAAEAEAVAVVRANESMEISAQKLANTEARLTAQAIAARQKRELADAQAAAARASLSSTAGLVPGSAAAQRGALAGGAAEAEAALLRTHFAEQEALGNVAVATSRATTAKVAMAGAARVAGSAMSGLVGLLGGPLGAALTAAAVGYAGYEIYTARAAAQTEKHTQAVDRLIEATKTLNGLNASGTLRTSRQVVDDQETAKDALRSARDQRNDLNRNLDTALGRAMPSSGPGSRQVFSPEIGADVALPLTTIDDAAKRSGVSIDDLREKIARLPPGSVEAAKAARQLADAVLEAAKTDTKLGALAQAIDDIATKWEKASGAAKAYVDAQAQQPKTLTTPLDIPLVQAPKFNPSEALESIKAAAKEVKDEITSIGDVDFNIKGLNTSREELTQFASDIANARATALGAISGQQVPQELLDTVQAFATGRVSASDYATALQTVGQSFPSFAPLIQSLVDAAQKALAAEAAAAALEGQVKGMDGLVANILIRIATQGGIPNITAAATAEEAKAQAAVDKVVAGNRVKQLRANGDEVGARLLEAQQNTPALDVPKARAAFEEQKRLEDEIAEHNKKPRKAAAPKKSQAQKDEETFDKKIEKLGEDADVQQIGDTEAKTVRFAQSAKVASDEIRKFIEAAKNDNLDGISSKMQQIYDKMHLLAGIKLADSKLDEFFPARRLADQLDSLDEAAKKSPEIAENLTRIKLAVSADAAPEWAKSLGGDITDVAKHVADGTEKIGDAFKNLRKKIIDLALDAALGPLKSALSSIFGSISGASGGGFNIGSLFGLGGGASSSGGDFPLTLGGADDMFASLHHAGGRVGVDGLRARRIPTSMVASAPRFHAGLTSREFPAVLEYGERVLTERQDKRTQAAMSGLADAAADMPTRSAAPINIAGDTVTYQIQQPSASAEQIAAANARNNAARDRNLGARINEHRQRYG